MTEHTSPRESVISSRRTVMGGLLGAGLGLPLLAACGSGSDESDDSGSSAGSPTTGKVGTTSEVPVGSGKIFAGDKVVVTQPTQGQYKAFSAICTHQGCPVTKISGEEIDCTCHGSKFSIKDGSVLAGPAKKPLDTLKVTVSGSDISVS